MRRFKVAVVVIATAGLAGCASTPDSLQEETARFIGGLTSDQVTVSDVQRGASNVSWKASTPSGQYNCDNNMYQMPKGAYPGELSTPMLLRRVNCVKQ